MGSYAAVPDDDSTEETGGEQSRLGDLLAGRLTDVEVDSVEVVREARERE
jgi:hypothetical protein